MRPARAWLAALLCASAAASAASAQKEKASEIPRRPRLERGADTNSASAYYYQGMTWLRKTPAEAASAFYWASRLDPSWAEPLYAQRIAFHMSDLGRFGKYVEGTRYVVDSKEVQHADSLLLRAMVRNPYLYRRLDKVLIEELLLDANDMPGLFVTADPEFEGWLAYASGKFDRAIEAYGRALRKKPDAHDLHESRAQAFYMVTQFDSAVTEMGKAVVGLRKKDEKRVTYLYESGAMYEYMAGLALIRAKKLDAARDAFGRALSEDLSFHMAHAKLGALALALGDSASAVTEYGLAVDLSPDDAALRYEYAMLLGNRGQYDEALTHLRKATESEPYFAPPYLALATVYDDGGFSEQAVASYTEYLARAPNNPAAMARIRARVTALSARPAAPPP